MTAMLIGSSATQAFGEALAETRRNPQWAERQELLLREFDAAVEKAAQDCISRAYEAVVPDADTELERIRQIFDVALADCEKHIHKRRVVEIREQALREAALSDRAARRQRG